MFPDVGAPCILLMRITTSTHAHYYTGAGKKSNCGRMEGWEEEKNKDHKERHIMLPKVMKRK